MNPVLVLQKIVEPLKQLSRSSLSNNAAELFADLEDESAGIATIFNVAD